MRELIERLEKATGPDREIDALIEAAIGVDLDAIQLAPGYRRVFEADEDAVIVWIKGPDHERKERKYKPPAYTASFDTALTLVPEDCGWLINWYGGRVARCFPASQDENINEWGVESCDAATPAIALCIAALKAREAQP